MLVLIDNYDSFTFNLYQYISELGKRVKVVRNDQVTIEELEQLNPAQLVVSPGPGSPAKDGGISSEAMHFFNGRIPILGVCLGHQCLGSIFDCKIRRALKVMHGKTSQIFHDGKDIFYGIPSPFVGMRYHSLLVYPPVPSELEVSAVSEQGEIMALRHRTFPTFGVQFHPESIMTEWGKVILNNFLSIVMP
ncbi:MAG: aminodeoxychorismate/anthranilate synthase component II [Chloroflexi bacterium]|nr:aminodeoxychorismate/anthranilate synthase component II [Chloroflexota bacterium]